MFTSLFSRLKWDSVRQHKGRSRASQARVSHARRRLPALETLEDRTVLSTLTVTSAADNGAAGTLRAVLAAAHNGDTIQFARYLDGSTITLTQGQLQVNASVTIDGPGANELTISGNSASRIFDIATGITSTISGLTVIHGSATDGAGILNSGTLSLTKDVMTDNIAQGIAGGGLFGDGGGRGGAVENQAGATLNLACSTISGDQAIGAPTGNTGAPGYGGGIDNEGGTLTVTQSVLTGNQATGGTGGGFVTRYGFTYPAAGGTGQGGAINSNNGTLTISSSTITGNTATGGPAGTPPPGYAGTAGLGQGGGLGSTLDTLTLTSSTISNNAAVGADAANSSAAGGGASIQDITVTISGTVFANNQATTPVGLSVATLGGGLYLISEQTSSLSGCLFTDNLAIGGQAFGGGVFDAAKGSISSTTFVGNAAEGSAGFEALGGGLCLELSTPFSGGTASLTNCDFALNLAEAAVGAVCGACEGGGLYVAQTTATATNCNFTENSATGAAGAPTIGFSAVGYGGGIDVDGGSVFTLTNSIISGNQAIGGPGGNGQSGGLANGGGLEATFGAIVTLNNALITGNVARGGVGGPGAAGGNGQGGGICNAGSTLSVTNSTLAGNIAQGGQGGSGAVGGTGEGGGILSRVFPTAASTTINNCLLTLNSALGGTGGSGASGGNGEGGGLFIGSGTTATLTSSEIVANVAIGGAAGSGGTVGQGVGGGVYNLGTANVDALTVIFANLASTSNDNVFGPITPI